TVVTLVAFGVAFSSGPAMSPFATMFFLWMATAASIRLTVRMAAVQLALIAICQGAIVTFQAGNSAPLFRWWMTTATAWVTAVIMRMVVERLFEVADLESTSRRAAVDTNAALESANQHKMDFLRGVRQELRWPVDEVTSASAALLDGSNEPLEAKQAEYARDIAGAGEQLWALIADIVDLATLESGGMTIDIADVNVIDVLHDAMANHVGQAEAVGVALEVDVEPSAATAWTDRDKLRRAVAGLVSNAVKFTPRGGRVQVQARVHEREMTIAVRDTGPGIPFEDRARIFEEFHQGRSALVAPGVGVGLTLARRFVELQGGRIELESEPGVGSTFTITLPVLERPPSARWRAPVA
ncbi:MAG: sensor histidine kinase, partial [Acidimicrobiales bacterium]